LQKQRLALNAFRRFGDARRAAYTKGAAAFAQLVQRRLLKKGRTGRYVKTKRMSSKPTAIKKYEHAFSEKFDIKNKNRQNRRSKQ